MLKRYQHRLILTLAILGLGAITGSIGQFVSHAEAQSSDRVFELRTYTTLPGRLDALHRRFADHTMRIFERHGMTNIGYFSPQDEPLSANTLIYLLAHDSREAADASWAAFIADPEWTKVAEESQVDGRIIEKLERVFLDPTSFSPMQ
jgi:hypothetical protein